MVRAQADRAVRELARGQWQVHSIFSHAINLANDCERRLLLLAPHQGRQVPGGILLAPSDFARLRASWSVGQTAKLTDSGLYTDEGCMVFDTWYDSTYLPSSPLVDRCNALIELGRRATWPTGFQRPFNALVTGALDQEIAALQTEPGRGVAALIGRGLGLTPAGDDFSLGYWLVNQTPGPWATAFQAALLEKISSPSYTTTVSRNYLQWALEGHFSGSLLALTNWLAGGDGQLTERVHSVIDYGNTSGRDTLAGMVAGLMQQTG